MESGSASVDHRRNIRNDIVLVSVVRSGTLVGKSTAGASAVSKLGVVAIDGYGSTVSSVFRHK
jgi:hypothetical protein